MWPFFPQRMDPTWDLSNSTSHTGGGTHRAQVKDDDDNNSALREDVVLLWWSKKVVAPTTRTFGERGARARGKVPHDLMWSFSRHFKVSSSSSKRMGKTKTLLCSF